MDRLGMEEGQPIEHNLVSKAIENAQKKVEARNFDIRKHLLEYDDVMNKHREIIYSLRKDILTGDGMREIVDNMMDEKVDELVARFTNPKASAEDWDIQGLKENLIRLFGFRPQIGPEDMGEEAFDALKEEDLADLVREQAHQAYEKRQAYLGQQDMSSLERYIILQIIDNQWITHLQDMEHMKEGIGLRGYGQMDPLREYKKEGYALFEELLNRIREESLMTLSRIQLLRRQPAEDEIPKKKKRAMSFSHGDGSSPLTVKRQGKKVGRNDPCPCGSGKKYKKCCGRGK